MALREILRDTEPTLRKKSREVTAFDKKLHTLLDDMAETLMHANGMGLAAPQVGVLRRVVVVEIGTPDDPEILELINPKILQSEGCQRPSEGCLSIPGLRGRVDRPEKVVIEAYDRYGDAYEIEGDGTIAQAFSHEIDHLDGILFVDKSSFEVIPEDQDDDNE